MKLSYLFSTTIIMIIMFTAPLFPYLLSNDDSACCHPAKVTVILCACAYLCVCNSLNAVCGKTSCVCVCATHTGGGVCGSYISTVRGGGGGRSEHDLSVVVMASPAAAVKCWSCEGSDATRSLNSGDVLCLSWSSCSCETKSESMNTSQNNSCAEAKAPHWHDTQNCCKWHECVIRLQWPGFFLYLFLCLFASLRSSLQIICKSLCFYVVFLHLSFTVCITAVILLSHCARLPCSGLSILLLCLF